MKLSVIILGCVAPAIAFSPLHKCQPITQSRGTELGASRRGFLDSAVVAAAAFALGPNVASAEPRPMYLTDPTEEFKANEEKAMQFKRAQLQLKKEFVVAIDRLCSEENDEAKLVQDMSDLQALVVKAGGLPSGIKKEEMYKQIRTKKAKGFWPTSVEVAYQSLKAEVGYQQSPNLDKELGNPYQ